MARPDRYTLDGIKFHKFSSEKSLTDLIKEDIEFFMDSIFDEKAILPLKQKYEILGGIKLSSGQVLPRRGARVDLWVECESGNKYLIEIKNPKLSNYDNFRAIGQLLGYSIKFPEHTRLVLVSSSYDEGLLELLRKYSLPIDFVLIAEDKIFLLEK